MYKYKLSSKENKTDLRKKYQYRPTNNEKKCCQIKTKFINWRKQTNTHHKRAIKQIIKSAINISLYNYNTGHIASSPS